MPQSLSKDAIQQIFTAARTHHVWQNKPVSDEVLQEIYNLAKWGPTSVNCTPMRILFIKTDKAKELLYPCLSGSNVGQVKEAPVTAVIAFDEKFYEQLPKLFTAFDAKAMFVSNQAASEITAFRNGSLQGAYFIIAARSLGLDTGPMSGFDNAKVDETFFKGTTWRSNFLCNIGFGDPSKLYPRGPRLNFAEACKII